MPSVSEAQRRAMEAAKAGRSTLGIPKRVAEKFVKADRAKARTARKKGRKRALPAKATVSKKRVRSRRRG